MALLALFMADAAEGGGRAWLLMLVVVAVLLILTGCVIALFTWNYQRKMRATLAEENKK
jgi:hypothetical protein